MGCQFQARWAGQWEPGRPRAEPDLRTMQRPRSNSRDSAPVAPLGAGAATAELGEAAVSKSGDPHAARDTEARRAAARGARVMVILTVGQVLTNPQARLPFRTTSRGTPLQGTATRSLRSRLNVRDLLSNAACATDRPFYRHPDRGLGMCDCQRRPDRALRLCRGRQNPLILRGKEIVANAATFG